VVTLAADYLTAKKGVSGKKRNQVQSRLRFYGTLASWLRADYDLVTKNRNRCPTLFEDTESVIEVN
jgi:hypothetical protein